MPGLPGPVSNQYRHSNCAIASSSIARLSKGCRVTSYLNFISLLVVDSTARLKGLCCHLQVVFDFVESLDQLDSWHYSLISTYPRLALSQKSAQQALSQLQLVPQATLFVQPEDGPA